MMEIMPALFLPGFAPTQYLQDPQAENSFELAGWACEDAGAGEFGAGASAIFSALEQECLMLASRFTDIRPNTETVARGNPSPCSAGEHHALPHDIRYRQEIESAAERHHLDPLLLAAVAAQETGGPNSNSGANVLGADGTGHGVFQIDSGTWEAWLRTHHNGMNVAENADKAAQILSENLKATHGNVVEALHLYNAGNLACRSTSTIWPGNSTLNYEDSVFRHLRILQADTT